jgi:predicted alpha/beta-fold hydrolase
LTVVPTGGHLGWLHSTSASNSESWMEDSALQFIEALESIHCTEVGPTAG